MSKKQKICLGLLTLLLIIPLLLLTIPARKASAANSYEWNTQNSIYNGTDTLTYVIPKGDTYLFVKDSSEHCGGDLVVVLHGIHAHSGNEYKLFYAPQRWPPGSKSVADDPDLSKFPDDLSQTGCRYMPDQPTQVAITGSPEDPSGGGVGKGEPCSNKGQGGCDENGICQDPNKGCDPVENADDQSKTCEALSSTSLEWILCPVFKIASSTANFLIGLFVDQLCFSSDALPSNTSCGTFKASEIQPAWSAIKNIASALLVIIMLLAVISQAFSIGPIDAYTIRKLLSKIVAAVILIQISFYLFSWIINIVNDIGVGLASLFAEALPSMPGLKIDEPQAFYQLLAKVGVSDWTATYVNAGLLLGLGVGVFIALPMLLLLVFTAVVSLLVGLTVLIFRKVLIIALLILAPLALRSHTGTSSDLPGFEPL